MRVGSDSMWRFLNIVASTTRFASRTRPPSDLAQGGPPVAAVDCLADSAPGQRFMVQTTSRPSRRSSVVRARQTFRARPRINLESAVRWLAGVVMATSLLARPCPAELFDGLDAYPPRWHMDTSDCDARLLSHESLPNGGTDGGCESIAFHADLGSEAILVYPIEPVRAVDDLIANVSLMSAKRGAKIGLRVRFPYLRDEQTRRPVSIVLYGTQYERAGRFQTIGVGNIERPLRIKIANLRGTYGSSANLDDAYVDSIVINAYSGPGATNLRLDNVSLRGMLPIGDHGRVDQVPDPRADEPEGRGLLSSSPATGRMLRLDLAVSADPLASHHSEAPPWVASIQASASAAGSPARTRPARWPSRTKRV